MFTLDAQRLVLGPIERIMKQMEELAKNPLEKLEMESESSLPWQGTEANDYVVRDTLIRTNQEPHPYPCPYPYPDSLPWPKR